MRMLLIESILSISRYSSAAGAFQLERTLQLKLERNKKHPLKEIASLYDSCCFNLRLSIERTSSPGMNIKSISESEFFSAAQLDSKSQLRVSNALLGVGSASGKKQHPSDSDQKHPGRDSWASLSLSLSWSSGHRSSVSLRFSNW